MEHWRSSVYIKQRRRSDEEDIERVVFCLPRCRHLPWAPREQGGLRNAVYDGTGLGSESTES